MIGLAVVLVAAVIGTVADYTGPADVIGGFGILVASAAGGAAFRYRAESWRRALDQIRSQERVGLARDPGFLSRRELDRYFGARNVRASDAGRH
jgi:hypothetical protein